jgi:hypothetical protein
MFKAIFMLECIHFQGEMMTIKEVYALSTKIHTPPSLVLWIDAAEKS